MARSHAARAALVAVAYWAGSQVDRFFGPVMSPAAIWPPNAILLAALLASPVRSWWLYLLAVAPVDRIISWPMPLAWGLTLYASNVSQSLMAASLLRLTWGSGLAWRESRFVALFLVCAVLLAPLASGLLGAIAVHAIHPGTPYAATIRAWFVANALTNQVLAPAISIVIATARDGQPHWSPRRTTEAVALLAGLLVASLFAFEIPRPRYDGVSAMLYTPLPFLLCIAMRFGVAGISLAHVAVVFVALHGVAHGRGPFLNESVTVSVLQVQLFLLALATPLLFLAAAACERRDAAGALVASERAERGARQESDRRGEQVRELAGRLIAAQEEERSRIARQLHDDLSQRLAAISLGLTALKRHTPLERQQDVTQLLRGAMELAKEFRSLSHELHPAVLRHAGLTAALRASCREQDGRNGIDVSFIDHCGQDPDHLDVPPTVALCLYRVAQEALRNVVRHSGARRATVALSATGPSLLVSVTDDGRGFETGGASATAAPPRRGIGLASMEERLRLVRGRLTIVSRPGRGTEIRAAVPAAPEDQS